jgi:hypothetical protein
MLITGVQVETQPLASDGLEGWPRKVRLLVAAERALRNIGNLPREERTAATSTPTASDFDPDRHRQYPCK